MRNDTIGIHYELPDGRIVYTCGFSKKGPVPIITYFFDNDSGQHIVTGTEFQKWKPRRDLRDFPNARDPRLPYCFDLFWDIKYISQLKATVRGHIDETDIRKMMLDHGITI